MNSELVYELLDRGKADWVMLIGVAPVVQQYTGITDRKQLRLETLQIIGELLDKDLFEVGGLTPRGIDFVSWGIGKEETIFRIADEWVPGEEAPWGNTWLHLTDRGEQLFDDMEASRSSEQHD